MMMFITISARDQSSQGRRRIWAFERRSAKAWQQRYSWPLPALSHWDVKVGGTSMEEMRVPCFAGSSPPFLGRERAAVDVDVGPDRRSPRYHETVFLLRVLKTAARRYVNRDVCVTGCACCVVQNVRKRSSPGARVETTGAAARNESARKCWRWPARILGDGDGPDTAPCTWQSCVPSSREGPCLGCLGEAVIRCGACSAAKRPEIQSILG